MRVEHLAEGITVYQGDSREILPMLQPVDALVTDPPYGVGLGVDKDMRGKGHGLGKEAYASYDDTPENFSAVVVPVIRAALGLSSRGAVFITGNLHALPKPDAIGGVYLPAATGRHCWGFNSLSLVALYGKAPDLNLGSKATALESVEAAEKNGHPCPKPLGWMRWAVDLASRAGETVLDPFMGSGTTGVACAKLGRRFIGIELEPTYFDIACRRISDALQQPDMFVARPARVKQPTLNI